MTEHFERKNNAPLSEAYRIFFEAAGTDSVDRVVEAAWEYFGLPVLLMDENYRLICQYPRQPLGQPIWDTVFEHGTVPLEVIRAYQQAYLNQDELFYKPFYTAEGIAADCPRIFGEVYTEERIYGHIGIFFFDCPLRPDDLAATQVFLDAVRMLMTPRRRREGMSLSACLRDLLDKSAAAGVRSLAYRSLAANVPGAYALVAAPIGSSASQRAFAAMAVSKLAADRRAAVSAIHRGCIVTLYGLLPGESYTERETAVFRRAAEALSPPLSPSGVSLPFTEVAEIGGRFEQAYAAALLAKTPCEVFAAVYPAAVFETVRANADVEMFLHPALRRLLAYDEANQPEYFRTLQVYSLTLHNKESTARILCVHRNTLLYRLGRIGELFRLPYEEQETALALLNSFQLYGVSILRKTDFGLSGDA